MTQFDDDASHGRAPRDAHGDPGGPPAWRDTLVLVLALTMAAPLLVALALILADFLDKEGDGADAAEPLMVTVAPEQLHEETPVTVLASLTPPLRVEAPTNGVVTASSIAVGRVPRRGENLVSINGVPYLAFYGPRPLWRPIELGTRGPDVASWQAFLRETHDLSEPVTGTADAATMAATRAFQRRTGVGDGSRVEPGRLVYLGVAPQPINAAMVSLGQSVRAGVPLLEVPAVGASVNVKPVDGAWPSGAGRYTLDVNGVSIPFDVTKQAPVRPEDAVLIAGVLQDATSIDGTVRAETTTMAGSVPIAAPVSQPDGTFCLFTSKNGPGQKVAAVRSSVVTARLPEQWVGRQVLANPREVRQDLTCS